jgi:hypothetical protein
MYRNYLAVINIHLFIYLFIVICENDADPTGSGSTTLIFFLTRRPFITSIIVYEIIFHLG